MSKSDPPEFGTQDGEAWNLSPNVTPQTNHGSILVAQNRGMAIAPPNCGPAVRDVFPPPWTLVQSWRGELGHSWIVVDTHASSKRVLILDSNTPKQNGPGFRGMGHIDHFRCTPPFDIDETWKAIDQIDPNLERPWSLRDNVQTWPSLFEGKNRLTIGDGAQDDSQKDTWWIRLKVFDLHWARKPVL